MSFKSLYPFLVCLIVAGLLVACSGEEQAPLPAQLEIVTARAQPEEPGSPGAAPTEQSALEENTTPTANPVINFQITAPALTTAATGPTTALLNKSPASSAAVTTASAGTTAPATATTRPVTPTPAAVKTATVTVAPAQTNATGIKRGVLLEPMTWESQTMNNCAPVSAMMALSYYNVKLTQEQCGKALRPNAGDKHVQPEELVAFIQQQGFKTVMRENGSLDLLRALLSAGVPVITQQWLHDGDDIGHYRVARGYDLSTNVFIYNDSMDKKAKTVVSSDLQDKLWKGYDRRYLPVYTAKLEAVVMSILGDDAKQENNSRRAVDAAQQYAEKNPGDIDAWRNLGYLMYAGGDCKAALGIWEQRLTKMLKPSDKGPTNRFLWYQLWPLECYNKNGNYAQVLKLAPNEIEMTKVFAEARYEYAVALVNTGKKDQAIAELKKALLDDQNYKPALTLLSRLGVN